MYWAIFVCFSELIFLEKTVWISKAQLVATELSPVDKVDCDAAYIAASNIPVIPTGNWKAIYDANIWSCCAVCSNCGF